MSDLNEKLVPDPEPEPIELPTEPAPGEAPVADIQTPVNDPTGSPFGPGNPPQNA